MAKQEKNLFAGLATAVLLFGTNLALAGHIEQPNFPRKPDAETDFVIKLEVEDCPIYVFRYELADGASWKFYYLSDNLLSHKPVSVVYSGVNIEKVLV